MVKVKFNARNAEKKSKSNSTVPAFSPRSKTPLAINNKLNITVAGG
jgi:hypothetical protein